MLDPIPPKGSLPFELLEYELGVQAESSIKLPSVCKIDDGIGPRTAPYPRQIHNFVWGDRGFSIEIVGDDGTRQTMLGFKTREAAEAWIVEDQRRPHEEVQRSLRTRWRF